MARTPQDPNEILPELKIHTVSDKVPETPTPTTNARRLKFQEFLPQLKENHGSFVKVLVGVDIAEAGKWRRAIEATPFCKVSTRRAHGSGNPRLRDVWVSYDESE